MKKIRLAIIRMSGRIGIKGTIKDSLNMLRLYNKYTCVLVPSTPSYLGVVDKLRDFVTWGEIKEDTVIALLEKRGRLAMKKNLTENYLKNKLKLSIVDFSKQYFEFKKELKEIPGLKLFFKLVPPRGGFERKGTKVQFSMGGALGYRGDKINDLIKKMI